MGVAKFRVAYELLLNLLNLPAGTEIQAVLVEREDYDRPVFTVVVSHPDLPPCHRVGMTEVCPQFVYVAQTAAKFVDWGIPPRAPKEP